MPCLLAVDMGLRTGLALFDGKGRLLWYRSQHYGGRDPLRRAVRGLLGSITDLGQIVIEGGGPIAEIWAHQASRRGIVVQRIGAEAWRRDLLGPREMADGARAKQAADRLAREIIERSGAARPTALRHDAAEAILIGHWALLHPGRLADRSPAGDGR